MALVVLLVASACGPDDPLPGDAAPSTFDRILAGERGFIPDPGNPRFDENPCFGLDGTDPIAALECPFVEMDIPGGLVLEPIGDGEPDLVITAHESAVISDNSVIHVVTVRNIGDADAEIPATGADRVVLQFYVSLHPFLDSSDTSSYAAAGGWSLTEMTLAPGEETELALDAGTGNPDDGFDYPDFHYAIGTLHTTPATDANPANNVSVSPLVPAP